MFGNDKETCREQAHVQKAVRHLFGPGPAGSRQFLATLSLGRVRQAFREQARKYHPDLNGQAPPSVRREKQEHFLHIHSSYEVLKGFLADRGPASQPLVRPAIIAVAGGKGGVGKSIVAANLAVHLAGQGQRVVLADLDPGGAALHFYLGETSLAGDLDDYLSGRTPDLAELLTPCRYGPWLLGGENSRIFAPQNGRPPHLKLWQALTELPADYLVLDIGSQPCPQSLDFFGLAHKKVVVTTCDPPAYLKAYLFLKAGVYRRLSRHIQETAGLREILPEFASDAGSGAFKSTTIPEILARVHKRRPAEAPGLAAALKTFRPGVVVNQARAPEQVPEVMTRLGEAARRLLGIDLIDAGSLDFQEGIARSTRDLIPAASRDSGGRLTRRLSHMFASLET